VFVDVNYDTACLDAALVAAAVSAKTKAILAVHLYGHPVQLDEMAHLAAARNIALIEDCAQAQGATFSGKPVGSTGAFGCFSFYPTKNLGALGDGGAVTGSRQGIELVRKLRTYGWSTPQYAELPFGRCSRLDELQAGYLNVRLAGAGAGCRCTPAGRADVPATGCRNCRSICRWSGPAVGTRTIFFVIKSDRRDALRQHLQEAGIMTGLHYPFPAHLQPGLSANARTAGSLDVTLRLQERILSLPMFATMSDGEIERVADGVRGFFGRDR